MTAQPNPQPDPPEVPAALVVPLASVTVSAAARQAVTDRLVAQVRAVVEAFHGWYDDLAVRRLAKEIGSMVRSAQAAAASNEDAYLTSLIGHLSGKPVRTPGAIADSVIRDLRKGVDPDRVYERLAVTYRYEVSKGASPEKALGDVLTRAAVMNDYDVALATRAQDRKTLQATHLAVAYRRVIHPELSKGGTCGMCIVASDRVYRKSDLMPIHARCWCSVSPILAGGVDPGSGINNLDLQTLYKDAQGKQAPSLKRTRYRVDEHGELGPTLVPKSKRRPRVGGRAEPALDSAPDGLLNMSDERLAHLVRVTDALPNTPYKVTQLARLRAEQARRAH